MDRTEDYLENSKGGPHSACKSIAEIAIRGCASPMQLLSGCTAYDRAVLLGAVCLALDQKLWLEALH